MRRKLSVEWLEAHKDYPHREWCLIWPYSRDSRVGRGTLKDRSGEIKTKWAHRVMCEMAHGAPPTDQHQAAHSCGKGHNGCVNPRHLSWKTNSENQLDRFRRDGRMNPNANGRISRYTAEQIAEMRSLAGAMKQTAIAAKFGCSLGTVQYYLKYREQRGHEPLITTIQQGTRNPNDRIIKRAA